MEKVTLTKEEWLEIVSKLNYSLFGHEKDYDAWYLKTVSLIYAFLASVYADDSLKEKIIETIQPFEVKEKIKVYNFVAENFSRYTKFRSQAIDYFGKMNTLLIENEFLGLNVESLLFVFNHRINEIYNETFNIINRIMLKDLGKERISSYYKLTDTLIESNLISKNNNMRYFEIAENAFSKSPKHNYDSLARIKTLINLDRINEASRELEITFDLMGDSDFKSPNTIPVFSPLAYELHYEYLIDQLIKKNIDKITTEIENGLDWGQNIFYRQFFTQEKPESLSESNWNLIKTKTVKIFKQNLSNFLTEPFDLPNVFSLVQMVKCLIYLDDTADVFIILDQIEIYLNDLILNYFPLELRQRFPKINPKSDLSNEKKEKFAQLLKKILRQIALLPVDQKEINFRVIEFVIVDVLELFKLTKNNQKLVQYYTINYEIDNFYKDVFPFYQKKVHFDEFLLKKCSTFFKTKKLELIALIESGLGAIYINSELTNQIEKELKNYDY